MSGHDVMPRRVAAVSHTIGEKELQAHIDRCDWCRNHPVEPCRRFESLLYQARSRQLSSEKDTC